MRPAPKPSFAHVYTGQEVDDVPVGDLQIVEQVGVTAVGDLPEAGVDEVVVNVAPSGPWSAGVRASSSPTMMGGSSDSREVGGDVALGHILHRLHQGRAAVGAAE